MAVSLPASGRVLALDVGAARIGLAAAHVIARLPQPLETISNNDSTVDVLKDIIRREDVAVMVVGIPRNMSGQETQQSADIRQFADTLQKKLGVELYFADESLSSNRADAYLKQHPGAAQDSIAACFILEEFLGTIETV